MKIYIAVLFIAIFTVGAYYAGYSQKSNLRNPSNTSNNYLKFIPPIDINDPSVISAGMNYALKAKIGDVEKKGEDKFLTLLNSENKIIGKYKLAKEVMIFNGKGLKGKIEIDELVKGRPAQVNIKYNVYKGGGETTHISYILMQ